MSQRIAIAKLNLGEKFFRFLCNLHCNAARIGAKHILASKHGISGLHRPRVTEAPFSVCWIKPIQFGEQLVLNSELRTSKVF
ncbi:MAG: hypothetical protein A4S12_07640 [Proteobacteria bacterium SG_bin5]|nr:MAG: hypothetical protein A4S12_07640 [Proteobacteria bacterium SG_bin5]